MFDVFLRQLIAPFVAFFVFSLAHVVSRAVAPLIPEGCVKRFLLKPRSTRSEFFERADEKMFSFFRSLLNRARSKQR
jgi:hypothetical protein